MSIYHFLTFVGGILTVWTFQRYISAVVYPKDERSRPKPSRATWLIWASLDYLLLASMYAKNAVNWQIVACVVGATTVFILSLKFGISGWTLTDSLCVFGGGLGLIGWIVFDNPNLAIGSSCLSVFIGSIPTFKSLFTDPTREDKLAWIIGLVSDLFIIGGIEFSKWDFAHIAQPIIFLVNSVIILFLIFLLPVFKKQPPM
ncbi:MAG: hypothetical protein AAB847_01405 [Patescibacteria group bacterium]